MSLNFGRSQLAIPGPSVMPERVLNAMHRPSPNIYEGELIEVTHSLIPDLKTVAQTKHDVAIYIANGHGAWEASLRNTVNTGEKVLVLATGRFGTGWAELAETLGIVVDVIDYGMASDADPQRLEEALRADVKGEIKAVLVCQTDTATSVRNDIPALRKAIDATGHDALFMVDCIASLGCDEFRMDDWGVDVMVAACQKGLMTPAGIAFVYFNDKAASAYEKTAPGFYFDWKNRADPEIYYQYFGGTAPTHHLYGLRVALDIMIHEEGIKACWLRHKTITHAYWAALEAWDAGGHMRHNIEDKAKRSMAVSSIETGPEEATRLRQWVQDEAGLTLGIGLGFGVPGSQEYERHFRIGHMGHQNIVMTMGVIGSMDCALKALGIPHGNGAIEAASSILAKHESPASKSKAKATVSSCC